MAVMTDPEGSFREKTVQRMPGIQEREVGSTAG